MDSFDVERKSMVNGEDFLRDLDIRGNGIIIRHLHFL